MIPSKVGKLHKILNTIFSAKEAGLYSRHLEDTFRPEDFLTINDLQKIPLLRWDDLRATPFLKRIYTDERLFVKVVFKDNTPILIGRTLADIKQENYAIDTCKRPLVLFDYNYESVEKSLWFYEYNILPLINLDNLLVTALAAEKYKIDAILTKTEIIKKFIPHLQKNQDVINNIRYIIIIDTLFDIDFLRNIFPNAQIKIILGLPETGAFAEACPEAIVHDTLIFHPDENSIVEAGENTIVSRLLNLPTPIIRYETSLITTEEKKICKCKEDKCFVLSIND